MIRVRYFAAAAEAAGVVEEPIAARTRGELIAALVDRHGPGLERVLARCSLLSGGTRLAADDDTVADGALVDVLPPFAGG